LALLSSLALAIGNFDCNNLAGMIYLSQLQLRLLTITWQIGSA